MSGTYNFRLLSGQTTPIEFTWFTGNPKNPVDLTDWEARMTLKPIDSCIGTSHLTTETGEIILGPEVGKVRAIIPAEYTNFLGEGLVEYDIELVKGDYVKRILQGRMRVSKNITR